MRMGQDLFIRVAAELFADHVQLVIKAGGPEARTAMIVAHQRDQRHARGIAVAVAAQIARRTAIEIGGDAQIGQAHELALAHRDAARDLVEIFAKGDLMDQLLHLAELTLGLQPVGPMLHLAQRFDIGGQPCQPVHGVLISLEQHGIDLARRRHPRRDGRFRGIEQFLASRQRIARARQKVGHHGRGVGLSIMGHQALRVWDMYFAAAALHRGFAGAAQQKYAQWR